MQGFFFTRRIHEYSFWHENSTGTKIFSSLFRKLSTSTLSNFLYFCDILNALSHDFIRTLLVFLYIFHPISVRHWNIQVLFFHKHDYRLNLSVSGTERILIFYLV